MSAGQASAIVSTGSALQPYFAYGSNMCLAQMARRCPGSTLVGRAVLAGYRWIITSRGYANVIPDEGGAVEGVLYTLSAADEAALDRYEGVAAGNYRKVMAMVRHAGGEVEALVYIDPITAEGDPKEEYIGRINAALADAGLSADYVQRSIRRFVPGAE